jgi:hypothetical protein
MAINKQSSTAGFCSQSLQARRTRYRADATAPQRRAAAPCRNAAMSSNGNHLQGCQVRGFE